jgi:hypothetical protein
MIALPELQVLLVQVSKTNGLGYGVSRTREVICMVMSMVLKALQCLWS